MSRPRKFPADSRLPSVDFAELCEPVDVDGRRVPSRMLARVPFPTEGVSVYVDLEVEAGAVVARSVTMAQMRDKPVTGTTLRRLDLTLLVEGVVEQGARRVAGWQRQTVEATWGELLGQDPGDHPPEVADLLRRVVAVSVPGYPAGDGQPRVGRRARRVVTDEFLHRVATVYSEALADGDPPRKAVAEAFHVDPRTATRYAKQARERGMLPPTTRGKAVA